MNKDNKILLLAFFIIIGTLLSSSIETITGRVVSKKTSKISISPSTVYSGNKIYVTVVPNKAGVNEDAFILNSKGLRLSSIDFCEDSYRCKDPMTFDFIIPNNWKPGKHEVRVYDYGIKDFIKGDFTIMEVN